VAELAPSLWRSWLPACGGAGPRPAAELAPGLWRSWQPAAELAPGLWRGVLGVAALVTHHRHARLDRRVVGTLVFRGVVAMAGVPPASFNALRTLDLGVALLLE
jgi:hypothetical protein